MRGVLLSISSFASCTSIEVRSTLWKVQHTAGGISSKLVEKTARFMYGLTSESCLRPFAPANVREPQRTDHVAATSSHRLSVLATRSCTDSSDTAETPRKRCDSFNRSLIERDGSDDKGTWTSPQIPYPNAVISRVTRWVPDFRGDSNTIDRGFSGRCRFAFNVAIPESDVRYLQSQPGSSAYGRGTFALQCLIPIKQLTYL